jgi:type III restriction enzyme
MVGISERTVERHMARQEELLARGVKVLSLFFIDRVANYVEADGIIRRLFVEAYQKLAPRFPYFRAKAVHRVHDGYFAKRKRKAGDGEEAWEKLCFGPPSETKLKRGFSRAYYL